jgi:hypothetical protein
MKSVSLRLGLRDVPITSRLFQVFIRVTRASTTLSHTLDDFDEMSVDRLIEECMKRSILFPEGVDENRLRRLLRAHDSSSELEYGRTEAVIASIDMDFQLLVRIDVDENLRNVPEIEIEALGVITNPNDRKKDEKEQNDILFDERHPKANSFADPTDCISLGIWKGRPIDIQSLKARKTPVKAHVLTEFIKSFDSPFHKRRPITDMISLRDGKAPLSRKTCIVMFCSLDNGFLASSSLIAKEAYGGPIKAKDLVPLTSEIVITGMELTNFRLQEKGSPFLFISYNKRRLWISKPGRAGLPSTTTHTLPEIRIPLCLFLDIAGESSSSAIDTREVPISETLSSSSLTLSVGVWLEATDNNEIHVADVGVSELHLIYLFLLTESTSLMLPLSKCREDAPLPKCKLKLHGKQKLIVPEGTVLRRGTKAMLSLPVSPMNHLDEVFDVSSSLNASLIKDDTTMTMSTSISNNDTLQNTTVNSIKDEQITELITPTKLIHMDVNELDIFDGLSPLPLSTQTSNTIQPVLSSVSVSTPTEDINSNKSTSLNQFMIEEESNHQEWIETNELSSSPSPTLEFDNTMSNSNQHLEYKSSLSKTSSYTPLTIEQSTPILSTKSNNLAVSFVSNNTLSVSAAESRTMQEAFAIMNNKDVAGSAEDLLLLNSLIPVSKHPLWRPNCLQLEPPPIEAIVAASLLLGEEPALALECALKDRIISELEQDIELVKSCLEIATSEADMGLYVPDFLSEILESVSAADIALEAQASIDSLSAVKIARSSSRLILTGVDALDMTEGSNASRYASSSLNVASSFSSSTSAINEAMKSEGAQCITRVSSAVAETRKSYSDAISSACSRDAQVERDGKEEWLAHRKAFRIAASVSRGIGVASRALVSELTSIRAYCKDAIVSYKDEVTSLRSELVVLATEIASREGLTLLTDDSEIRSSRHRVGIITLQDLLQLCEQEPVERPAGRKLRFEVAEVAAKKEVADMYAIIGRDRSARQHEDIMRGRGDLSSSEILEKHETLSAYDAIDRILDDDDLPPSRKEREYNVFSVEAERLQKQIDSLTLSITSIRRSISKSESLQQMRLAVSALWRIHETNPNFPITSNDMNKFYVKALDRAPYSDHFYEELARSWILLFDKRF